MFIMILKDKGVQKCLCVIHCYWLHSFTHCPPFLLTNMAQPGGSSRVRNATAEDQQIADQVKEDVVEKVGRKLSIFIVVGVFTDEVPAANIYFMKVKVEDNDCAHIRIHVNRNGKAHLHSVQDHKSQDSQLEYF
ncbi:cystatin-A [Xenopus laevis]|uniref:Cystatin domain-containing protein n=2 Tax=Xenopus laevis TaxID=8355 RepID=A0A974HX27_XENLA|nr:cystatin-A [Xenopus laevis]OCT93617.1 hypothetical protein XELAEV_18011292mg [Xenopus laevis]